LLLVLQLPVQCVLTLNPDELGTAHEELAFWVGHGCRVEYFESDVTEIMPYTVYIRFLKD
jgi:hypothetical protein